MDNQTNIKYVVGIVVGITILLVVFIVINNKTNGTNTPVSSPGLATLAMCLKDSGTIMYGAFWCPHCAATKKMFGSAAADLPYHECSTPDGQSQLPECDAVGVKGYPTWVFPDGSRLEGETTLATLASRSGCPLPADLGGGGGVASTTSQSSSASSVASSSVKK